MSESASAGDMLAQADRASRAVRRSARWWGVFWLVFGCATIVLAALTPVQHAMHGVVYMLVIFAFVFGMSTWSRRQRVQHSWRRMVPIAAWWVATWMLLVGYVGPHVIGHRVTLWALAGVVVGLPCFVRGVADLARYSR